MIIASAQIKPTRFAIDSNLQEHYKFIELASENRADLIIFPEMSITGYERDNAREMAFTIDDERLRILRDLAISRNMIIIAGAPILINNNLYIGSFILKPDNTVEIYTKQFLHPGEELFFQSSFNYNPLLEFGHEKISLAICADIDHPEHSEKAGENKTSIYLPSIFFSPQGLPDAYQKLSKYAADHSMCVLMSNFAGQSWGCDAGGKSGFWNNKGELITNMNDKEAGILFVEKNEAEWICTTQVVNI